MNGIDNIIARIEADSAAEIKVISDDAAAKCSAIIAKGDADARAEYGRLITEGSKEATARINRLTTVTNLELKKQTLATKQKMVAACFDRAVEMIAELPEEQYVDLLVRLAVDGASTGYEKLIFSVTDRVRIGKQVCIKANEKLERLGRTGSLTLSEQTRNIKGGVILSGGDIEVNCSAEALVSQLKNEMAAKVADVLFD